MTSNRARSPRTSQTSPNRGLRIGALTVALAVLAVAAVAAIGGATPFTIAGFTAKVTNGTNTVATAPYFSCTAAERADMPSSVFLYYLNEPSGSTTAVNAEGTLANATYQGSMISSTAAPIACSRDSGGAYVLDGSTSFVSAPLLALAVTSPSAFTEEVWFKTTVAGGKLIGFGSSRTGLSRNKDRHIYLNSSGQLVFGTANAGVSQTVTTTTAYNDGKWHHVAGTLSASQGMVLYVDGRVVATNPTFTTADSYFGYWRVGYDNLSGWPGAPSNFFFTGSMRYAAAYSAALTAQQISNHYAAGQ